MPARTSVDFSELLFKHHSISVRAFCCLSDTVLMEVCTIRGVNARELQDKEPQDTL